MCNKIRVILNIKVLMIEDRRVGGDFDAITYMSAIYVYPLL